MDEMTDLEMCAGLRDARANLQSHARSVREDFSLAFDADAPVVTAVRAAADLLDVAAMLLDLQVKRMESLR